MNYHPRGRLAQSCMGRVGIKRKKLVSISKRYDVVDDKELGGILNPTEESSKARVLLLSFWYHFSVLFGRLISTDLQRVSSPSTRCMLSVSSDFLCNRLDRLEETASFMLN